MLIYAHDNPEFKIDVIKDYIDGIKVHEMEDVPCSCTDLPIMSDKKLHDIPHTVYKSTKKLVEKGASFITVHISGGVDMLKAAKRATKNSSTKIIGVTLLTSLSYDDAYRIYRTTSVNRFIKMAKEVDIDGIVCSPSEVKSIRKSWRNIIMCPGIRCRNTKDDQKRIGTASQAIKDGANYVIVGRAISDSDNYVKTILSILDDIKGR